MTQLTKELADALAAELYDQTDDGLYFPQQGVLARGQYFDRVNGGAWQASKNLLVTQGLAHMLNVAFGNKAKSAAYYIALFNGSADPAANMTASNFASALGEIVSTTEGYTAATRQQWTPATTNGQTIDNFASTVSLTIATSSSLNVTGVALLTSNVRGGTGGELISADKYPVARTFQNGDVFEVGYRIALTV